MRLATWRSAFAGILQKDLGVIVLNRGVGNKSPVETQRRRFFGNHCRNGGLCCGCRCARGLSGSANREDQGSTRAAATASTARCDAARRREGGGAKARRA